MGGGRELLLGPVVALALAACSWPGGGIWVQQALVVSAPLAEPPGLSVARVDGLVVDPGGATLLLGDTEAARFDGVALSPAGGGDLLLARYGIPGQPPLWVRTWGDSARQTATGLALATEGRLAVLGRTAGAVNGVAPPAGRVLDVLLVVRATDGVALATLLIDTGSGGRLAAVAANPAAGVIAVCGWVDGTAGPVGAVVPAAEFRGGRRDAALVLLDAANGAVRWRRSLGSADDEECDALAVDEAGDVFAAGQYSGALDLGPGGARLDETTSAPGKLWVARFGAADGATVSAAAFGRSGATVPTALALDARHQVLVVGHFSHEAGSPLRFGGSALESAGGADAFAAKLDPEATPALAPVWAVRLGGAGGDEALAVATGPREVVLVAGSHAGPGSTTGVAALPGGVAGGRAFLLQLRASDGAAQFAASYGDGEGQTATGVATGAGVLALGGTSAGGRIAFGGSVAPARPKGPPVLTTAEAASFLVFGQAR